MKRSAVALLAAVCVLVVAASAQSPAITIVLTGQSMIRSDLRATKPEALSMMKGLLVGVLVGWFATRVRSMPLGLAFGLVVSAFFAWLVAWMGGQYYLEIILPGSIVGLIVGYATQSFGASRQDAELRSRTAP